MHAALQLLLFWILAFVTLGLALTLLNIFYSCIGNDLTLRSLGQEAIIAAIASLVEGGSAWLVVTFIPAAARALVVPALIVALIYKLSHLEDWNRYDVVFFLLFQLVIVLLTACLFLGHFGAAVLILAVFGGILALVASIIRSL